MTENQISHTSDHNNRKDIDKSQQLFMIPRTVSQIDENYSDSVNGVEHNQGAKKPFPDQEQG